jgi:diguanylate cyclase (GGDEF)-like protein
MAPGKIKKIPIRPFLNSEELKILKLVDRGKSTEEIGAKLGKTKGAVVYRLGSIMKKLRVKKRTGAVGKAVELGLLPQRSRRSIALKWPKVKVGVVGCGRGGSAILEVFGENPFVEVSWAVDKNPKAHGMKLARKLKIPVSKDFTRLVKKSVDVVIDVSGSSRARKELERIIPPHTELVGGLSARLMWQLIKERGQRLRQREGALKGYEALYKLGLVIESSDSIKDIGKAIVDYATRLTGTPAASLAIFDERGEDMYMVGSKGFSRGFEKKTRWKIRKAGITGYILNQDGPLYISDLRENPHLNPMLIKEGVRTLMAAPLTVEKRILGILYVNDFTKRIFTEEQISLFSLLTIYAALAIERVKTQEQIMHLSITDGLTGLYNHRYLMEQMEREIEKASRYNTPLSIIMLDIDRFKDYNDRFGHLEGNKVLKRIASILLKNTRVSDTVGRFGGEEFLIILPEVKPEKKKEGALVFGRRLIKQIAAYPMPNKNITLSGGIATYPADGKTRLELLMKADKHMYMAKKEGRNRVCG